MIQQMLQIFDEIVWPARYSFTAVFFVVLATTYSFLVIIDFVPEPPEEDEPSRSVAYASSTPTTTPSGAADRVRDDAYDESDTDVVGDMVHNAMSNDSTESPDRATQSGAKPVRMVIDALDREIPVLNPTSRMVPDLDAALRDGAVRHPDAADFAREGNIFILGHSSRLPNVINRNYQIFNGIEKLQWGDTIRLYSEDTEYIYRVDRVYEARASEATIPIAGTGPRLTLATCDSFGSIDDRFIVEAELQSSRPL